MSYVRAPQEVKLGGESAAQAKEGVSLSDLKAAVVVLTSRTRLCIASSRLRDPLVRQTTEFFCRVLRRGFLPWEEGMTASSSRG